MHSTAAKSDIRLQVGTYAYLKGMRFSTELNTLSPLAGCSVTHTALTDRSAGIRSEQYSCLVNLR